MLGPYYLAYPPRWGILLFMGRPRIRSDEDKRLQRTQYRKNHRIKRWLISFEYLKGKVCEDCGEGDPLVLEFDHLQNKSFSISQMVSRSEGSLQELANELLKCRVVCRNCHVKKHHKERNTLKWRYISGGDLYE